MLGIGNIISQLMQLINMQKGGTSAGSAKYQNRKCILQKRYTEEFTSAWSVQKKIKIYESKKVLRKKDD